MHARFGTRVRALLLALVLALGTGPALVHGSLMAAATAVAAEPGHPTCDESGGHDCAADGPACLSFCGSAAQGVLPAQAIASRPISRPVHETDGRAPGGWSGGPAHGPPKLALG